MSDEQQRSTPVNQLPDVQPRELTDFMNFVNMITNASDVQHDLERPTAEERGVHDVGSVAESIIGSLFHFVPIGLNMAIQNGIDDGNGADGNGADGSMDTPLRSMIRHARRLREEDQERLELRDTVQLLMQSYNWQEQDWGGGYIYTSDIFMSPEDRALQDAITRSMEDYESPLRPADPDATKNLEKIKASIDMTDSECPICLGEISVDEDVVSAAACKHYMHTDCADNWFLYGDFCTVCKLPVGGVKETN